MATRPERHLWVSSEIGQIRIEGLLGSRQSVRGSCIVLSCMCWESSGVIGVLENHKLCVNAWLMENRT
jgi:hypothetical protein